MEMIKKKVMNMFNKKWAGTISLTMLFAPKTKNLGQEQVTRHKL